MDVALGIDIGTSGVRIAAVSPTGEVAAFASAAMETPLNDPKVWWSALEHAFAKLDVGLHKVVALAIDGTSGTILPIDGNGNPLAVGSMYNDAASSESIAKVAAVAPKQTAALGGTSPLARALPIQGAARILHQADWIAGTFCGRFDVSDENNALKTGYDPLTRMWPNWIEKTGLNVSLLPRVVPVGTAIGTVTSATASKFNLPRDTVVVSGTTDGCAAFLASGADQAGDGVSSLGTTLTIKLLSATPVFAPEYGVYSHRIGDWWLAGGASNSGGGVLQHFFSREQLDEMTPRLSARATGLNYYPLIKPGERFPIADPKLPPRLEPRPTDDVQFYQGMLEGIADIEKLAYERLAELGASRLKAIRSVGGGAGNAAWSDMRLRRLGVPALSSLSEQAAVGTALLAWRGVQHAH